MESQLSGWWVADVLSTQGPVMLFSWAIWVVLSICLHELGHGIAAIKLGDNTPRVTGHMTMDPLTHMGGFSLIMFALVGIAWGAMPVNPHNFRHKHGDAIVSFAGPAVNVLLAIFCIVVTGVWIRFFQSSVGDPVGTSVTTIFLTGAMLNIVLFLLNMMPVPPLDGSHILADFVPSYRRLLEHPNAPMISMVLFVLIFFKAGGVLFDAAIETTWTGVNLIAGGSDQGSELGLVTITTQEQWELFLSHVDEPYREALRIADTTSLTQDQMVEYFIEIAEAMAETGLEMPEEVYAGEIPTFR